MSRGEFPHSSAAAEGMRVIEARRGLSNVYVHLNVPYAEKSGRVLHLQIVQVSGDGSMLGDEEAFARRHPCIVFVQGSAWQEQALGSSMAFWCHFAERGYTVAIVEYRPSSVAAFPAQVQDAKTAVRWLRANSDVYGIDPDQMVMAGDSSGGHTALMVHATQDLDVFDDEPGQALGVGAFIDFFGPTDLGRLNDDPTTMDHSSMDSPEGQLLGGVAPAQVPELVRQANPATWVTKDALLAPLLIVHGSKDRIIPFAQSVYHYDALKKTGQPVELVQVRDGDHGIWPAIFNDELAEILADFIARAAG